MSNSLTAEILAAIPPRPEGFLIITIGNTFRHDDGVGPYLATLLRPHSKIKVIDAGQNPENIVDEVIALAPAAIAVVDAADFGGQPGEVRLIPEDLIPETTLSTHMIPMNVILRLITETTRSVTAFIGIQALSFDLGEGLSQPVKAAADALAVEIIKRHT